MKKLIPALTLFLVLFMPIAVGAQDFLGADYQGQQTTAFADFKTKSGMDGKESSLVAIIGNVVRIVLVLVGIIVLVIIVYAGFLWMTAGGNEDQVKKAKQWLINAVVGLALIMAAYAISSFVVTNLSSATTIN